MTKRGRWFSVPIQLSDWLYAYFRTGGIQKGASQSPLDHSLLLNSKPFHLDMIGKSEILTVPLLIFKLSIVVIIGADIFERVGPPLPPASTGLV